MKDIKTELYEFTDKFEVNEVNGINYYIDNNNEVVGGFSVEANQKNVIDTILKYKDNFPYYCITVIFSEDTSFKTKYSVDFFKEEQPFTKKFTTKKGIIESCREACMNLCKSIDYEIMFDV